MPVLMIALLALLVFGVIGILLSGAMILEHSTQRHAKGATAHPPPALPLR